MPVGERPLHGTHALTEDNQRRTTVLMYACQQGDFQRVKELLRTEPSLTERQDRTLKTALHYCAGRERKSTHCADLLVMAAPGLVETRDEDGFTPLHLAVISGNMQLVTFLLANGAEVNALDSERHSVVHWATVCGEAASLCAVLSAGAEVSTPDVHGGFPLHYAAQMCGSERDQLGLQVLHILLSQTNCNVSVADNDGRQPLLWAASAGSAKAVLALVRAGAVVESPDKDGLTALHCAASRGHTDCLDTLLTLCGATPDVIDTNGCTALHYSVTLGHADATALLLNHGSDPNRQDRKGRSPAHCGCAKGQLETVKLLGTHGANLWLRNARGDLPLHEAASSGRRDLVSWLLDQRPSQVNARNNDGRCPLHLAALNDNSDMCKILLDAGAFVNPVLRTSKNLLMTPLDCAMQRGFRSTAKFLQLHGGIPATRISTLRVGSEINANVSLSSNLHIREDITVLGGSSSETDVDERKDTRPKRRSIRRRVAYRYGRKDSASDENTRTRAKARPAKRDKSADTQLDKTDGLEKSFKAEEKRKSRDNDYDDITGNNNSKEDHNLITTPPSEEELTKNDKQDIETNKKISDTHLTSEKPTRQRPKSAKKRDFIKRKLSTDISAPLTVEGTIESEVDHENGHNNNIQPDLTPRNKLSDDEQSKTMVVEAAVHMPPKKINDEELENKKSSDEKDEEKETKSPREEIEVESDKNIEESTKAEENLISSPKEEEVSSDSKKEDIQTDLINQEVDEQISADIEAEIKDVNGETEKIEDPEQKDNDKEIKSDIKDSDSPKSVINEPLETEEKILSEDLKDMVIDQTEKSLKIIDLKNEAESIEKSEDTKTEDTIIDKEINEIEKSPKTTPREDLIKSEVDIEENNIVNDKNIVEKTIEDTKVSETTSEVINKEEISEKTDAAAELTVDEAKIRSNEINIDLSLKKFEEFADMTDSTTDTKPHKERRKKHKKKLKTIKDNETDDLSPDKHFSPSEHSSSETDSIHLQNSELKPDHKSFQVLEEEASFQVLEDKIKKDSKRAIHRPTSKLLIDAESSSDILDLGARSISREKDRKVQSSCDNHTITLPLLPDKIRSESNLSAPHLSSVYSDNEQKSDSNTDELGDVISSGSRKKRFKKRPKARLGVKSAGSDYESSVLIDSGFEPSPRSSRIPKRKVMSERGVNMTSVTQSIQTNIRRYHMERKIFQHLLDLKRLQIRSGQTNEAVLVKRAIDAYHNSVAATVGAGRYPKKDYSYRSFEQFLYQSLRMLQRGANENLKGLPETPDNPLLCTQSTHRCLHATHAYTGVPCAAYIAKLNHHTMPKIGFTSPKTSSFLPQINTKGKAVTLELCHGNDKQVISLPADRLDQNKRYYVTFTVKGQETQMPSEQNSATHRHSKSV